MKPAALVTDAVDLVLSRSCLHCGLLGRVLCGSCVARLRGQVEAVTVPAGGVPAFAALPYEGPGRELVLSYKERGNRALAPMLGLLLADAIDAAARSLGTSELSLVPVPAHRRAPRGFDALAGIVRHAHREVGRRGLVASVVPAVVSTGQGRPMKSLSAADRRVDAASQFRIGRRRPRADVPVAVVDDVVTTGSTFRSVAGALSGAGIEVAAFAAVTAVAPSRQPG